MAKAKVTASTPDAEFIPRNVVYAGIRRASNGTSKVIALFLVEDDGKLSEKALIFDYKRTRARTIGGIYQGASFSPEQARGLDHLRWQSSWVEPDGLVATWEAEEHAALQVLETKKLETEAGRVSEIERMLKPLRIAYQAANERFDHAKCGALESAVLSALRTRLRKHEERPTYR